MQSIIGNADTTQHTLLLSLLKYSEELTRIGQMYGYNVVSKYDREASLCC